MLDRKGLVTEYFYHEEEARSALGNVEYVDKRDVIQILDVVEGMMFDRNIFNGKLR